MSMTISQKMRPLAQAWAIAAAVVLLASAARPPVDTAGPITAKLEGPEQIRQNSRPEPLAVVLENSGATTIQGTVRVEGIDRWRVEPAGLARFSVNGKGSARLEFKVTPAAVIYNAYYPIHAYVEFDAAGGHQTAHPILLVPVQIENPPQPELPSGLKVLPAEPPGPTATPVFPPASASARYLGTIGRYRVQVWPGSRGLLDATVVFQDGSRQLFFHGFHAQVLGASLENPDSRNKLIEAREESANGHYRVRHRFQSWAGPFDLVTDAWIEKGALRTRFTVENATQRPWLSIHLEDLAAGPWSDHATRIYAGAGNVMQEPQTFRLKYNGHFLSTSFIGIDFAGGISVVEGVDVPPDHLFADPGVRSYSLHAPHNQVVSFIPSADVWTAARTFREIVAPKVAGGVPRVAGRFTIDLWRGRYSDTAKALAHAFHYGLTDTVLIWHRWQHWGYDYRLPDIYPPSAEWGSEQEFLDLAAICKNNGVLFAPHDNYVDIYPDSDGFSYDKIAFTADRKPQTAFLNRGLGAQSYHPNSDAVMPLVSRNMKLIKEGFSPNAYFIDVWSSEPPYDYYDASGRFFDRLHTRDVWREAFAYIRDYLGGAPQISEAGADQYIGWLDAGAGAHMRAENGPERSNVWHIETQDTERVPWFDNAYHDVFVLEGSGYPGRYNSGQDNRSHGMYSDDYITTEVMTGHPAMVWDAFTRDTVRKYWLLHDLMRGLALRRMDAFGFDGANLHRQQIRWENGGQVWVNRGSEDWQVSQHVLPQYGFYARVPVQGGASEAAVERQNGLIVEWAKSPETWYCNARPVVPEPQSGRGGAGGRGATGPDPRLPRMNRDGRVVSFGAVSTNGGFRLVHTANAVELTPLPSSTPFQVSMRWSDLPWKLATPKEIVAIDEDGAVLRRQPVTIVDGEMRITPDPDVFSYRIH